MKKSDGDGSADRRIDGIERKLQIEAGKLKLSAN
jgi:hypothetical protein